MLNQFTTPPRIPKPSPVPQNQEQFLHVVLHERQIQQQQRYYTPQLFKPPSMQTISTQLNSPVSNQPKQQQYNVMQQVNQNDMQNQYNQIMQYYKELEYNMQQQKQENYLKYNEILQKIEKIQQTMVYSINQLNINQRNEYQQLLNELQQQRLENQKRYQQMIKNIEQQKDQNYFLNQFQQREQLSQKQHQIIDQQKPNLSNQNNNIIRPPQPKYQTHTPGHINLEQKIFPLEQHPQDQLNYSQIHNRYNTQFSPQVQISKRNLSQDNNTFGINSSQLTPFIQQTPSQINPPEQYNFPSNKQLMDNQMSNQIVQQTKSPLQQISPGICINSPNYTRRDNSISHQEKQIFEKPNFGQVNNQPTINYNPPIKNQDKPIIQQQCQVKQQYNSNESVIIDESNNSSELLQQLKAEYGIDSLPQNTSLQSISHQLQLIYCISCDQYISLQLSDKHLQDCISYKPQRRQNDSYLDNYILYRGYDFFIETVEAKQVKICKEITKIKLMMQLAQLQKWTTYEYIQLRELCQIANIILDKLLSNPNTSQIIKYYQNIQQIFNVVYMAPQIFYKQQAKLLQKCLDRIKELHLLLKI